MSVSPFISVIIPVYNDSEALQTLLANLVSVRSIIQEVIVVMAGVEQNALLDDQIKKGLTETVEPIPLQLLTSKPQRAGQMNHGAAMAKGRVLWFLHADTLFDDGIIESLIAFDHNQAHSWGRFDVCLSPSTFLLNVVARMMNWRSGLTCICTGDQGIFVRRAAFDQVSGFPDQPLMEDIELSKRLKRISLPFRIKQPLITSSRKWLRGGVIRTIGLMWYLRFIYWLGASPEKIHRIYYGS